MMSEFLSTGELGSKEGAFCREERDEAPVSMRRRVSLGL